MESKLPATNTHRSGFIKFNPKINKKKIMIIIIKTSVSKLEFCQLNSTQVFFSIFGCDKTIIRTDLAREID